MLYDTLLAILNPSAQKKQEQQFNGNQLNRLHNNLKLYNKSEGNHKSGNEIDSETDWNQENQEKNGDLTEINITRVDAYGHHSCTELPPQCVFHGFFHSYPGQLWFWRPLIFSYKPWRLTAGFQRRSS